MISDVTAVLKKLGIKASGQYDDQFYIIKLKDSDDYARMYTTLGKVATNTEYPNFGVNKSKTTIKITNYFETEVDNITYDIFLIADFDKDEYTLKIAEK